MIATFAIHTRSFRSLTVRVYNINGTDLKALAASCAQATQRVQAVAEEWAEQRPDLSWTLPQANLESNRNGLCWRLDIMNPEPEQNGIWPRWSDEDIASVVGILKSFDMKQSKVY